VRGDGCCQASVDSIYCSVQRKGSSKYARCPRSSGSTAVLAAENRFEGTGPKFLQFAANGSEFHVVQVENECVTILPGLPRLRRCMTVSTIVRHTSGVQLFSRCELRNHDTEYSTTITSTTIQHSQHPSTRSSAVMFHEGQSRIHSRTLRLTPLMQTVTSPEFV
jgi:hypothetical protein